MDAEKEAKRKAAQAVAHKKWRESEKGKAYYLKNKDKNLHRQKLRDAGIDVVNIENGEVTVK